MPTKKVINLPKPTKKEVEEAIAIQDPNSSALAPQQAVTRSFSEVERMANSAQTELAGADVWAKPEQLFKPTYEGGAETLPFYVLRSFPFESNSGYGDRMGVQLMFSNGKVYSVAFPYNPEDTLRTSLLEYFQRSTIPLGPMVIVKRPNKKGSDYYQFVPNDAMEPRGDSEPDLPW